MGERTVNEKVPAWMVKSSMLKGGRGKWTSFKWTHAYPKGIFVEWWVHWTIRDYREPLQSHRLRGLKRPLESDFLHNMGYRLSPSNSCFKPNNLWLDYGISSEMYPTLIERLPVMQNPQHPLASCSNN